MLSFNHTRVLHAFAWPFLFSPVWMQEHLVFVSWLLLQVLLCPACALCFAVQRYCASDASMSPRCSSFPVLAKLMAPSLEGLQQLGCSVMPLDGPTFPHGKSLLSTQELIQAIL